MQLDFFHNTIHLDGPALEKENLKAESLENRVLDFFEKHKGQEFIWSDVAQLMGVDVKQYGSVKRCMSHLVTRGKVIMLKEKKKSIFGGDSHKHVLR